MNAIVGSSNGFTKHTLFNSNAKAEKIPVFAQHAIPALVKGIMRGGETIFIPSGKDWFSFAPQEKEPLAYTVLPAGQAGKARMDFVIKAVLDAGGTFYSAAAN